MMQTNLVTPINFKVDIDRLKYDSAKAIELFPFNRHGQICLVNTSATNLDPYEGTGDSRVKGSSSYGLKEADFTVFNSAFNDTVFEEIFKFFPYKMGRIRLMKISPKTCYPMHIDPNMVRYHFAIDTNEDCFILYRNHEHYNIPADGICYRMNTEEYHTAINASKQDRIHLVISGLL